MKNELRQKIYNKYDGHCAYCGRKIEYKDMQVDHLIPKYHNWSDEDISMNNKNRQSLIDAGIETTAKHIIRGTDDYNNLMPSCRQCNYRKATLSIEEFRRVIGNIIAILDNSVTYKMAKYYGLIIETEKQVKFYFELKRNK